MKYLKAAIISLGSVSSQWISNELKKYFDKVDFLQLRKFEVTIDHKESQIFYDGEELGDYDCVYVRGSGKYAQLLRCISSILEQKERIYLPLKSSVFTIAHDKLLTNLYLQKAGVPMPCTYLVSNLETGKHMLKRIKYPIVLKFPEGTHGKGVMFAESYASASALVDAFTALKQPFLIQEFIDNDGSDYRAIVVGDEVVASMKRIAAKGENRSNVHAGGSCVPFDLPAKFKHSAIAAARAVNADIIAVDLMESGHGPVVLEVNSSPGLQGITAATGINVADKIAKFLAVKTINLKKIDSKLLPNLKISNQSKHLSVNIKIRNGKIILPEFLTNATSFREDEELIFEVKKGKLIIERI